MDIFDRIIEAIATDLQRKQKSITRLFPSFPDRVKAVADKGGIRLSDTEDTLWHFKIHSGTKDSVWYDSYVKFKGILPTLEKVVKDRRLWVRDKSRVDRRKMARKFMNKIDIQLLCSCPADLYYGGHYLRSLGKYDAKYTNRELRPPKVRNPKQYGMYCKHLANLMRVLPFYADTMMKWLDDFYSEDIKRFEEEARKEYGWVKTAAKKLTRKKEEVPKEEEQPEQEEETEEVPEEGEE